MLTPQMHRLLMFIYGYNQENGTAPTFDEMRTALELASKSSIHSLLVDLAERGYIKRLPNRARAVEVIRLPADVSKAQSGKEYSFQGVKVVTNSRVPEGEIWVRSATKTLRMVVNQG